MESSAAQRYVSSHEARRHPAHACHALARRLLAEASAIRGELGRAEDTRRFRRSPGPNHEVYFEAIVTWRKAARLASELGVDAARPAPATPPLGALRQSHVYQLLEGVLAQIDDIKQRLGISERTATPTPEQGRQPSDVLVTIVRINRDLSRSLERVRGGTRAAEVLAWRGPYPGPERSRLRRRSSSRRAAIPPLPLLVA